MKTRRLFIAALLPDDIVSELTVFMQNITAGTGIRIVPSGYIHLTLCFIGDKPENEIPAVTTLISDVILKYPTFEIDFERLMLAPKHQPYMIWAKFRQNNQFSSIFYQLHDKLGLPAGNHTPVPHVTLSRYKGKLPFSEQELGHFMLDKPVAINKVILFESVLHQSGAKYFPLQQFSLR